MTPAFRLDLFCRVVDNFGDAGVCWRLARQLAKEYPIEVRLWIDRLKTLEKIASGVNANKAEQHVSGVTIALWPDIFPDRDPASLPDVVVEGFGCRLPDNYLQAMTRRSRPPVWINMEYLSAESWVNDCHRMASPQSSLPLTKYFFFPGFAAETGGLFREADLIKRRRRFQQEPGAQQAFLRQLDVTDNADCIVSLFCYDNAPAGDLFDMLSQQQEKTVLCLVPEGVAADAVSAFSGQQAKAGEKHTQGGLTVQVIPLVDQDDYDRLLWSCDLNFVRGEDSFLRAQWAARPFVWQIYPQDDDAHVAKLDAFSDHYFSDMPGKLADGVRKSWRAWNDIGQRDADAFNFLGRMLFQDLPTLKAYGIQWADKLARMEDFASSLFRFINTMR